MVKLIIAGDSTAATKMTDKRPETGWEKNTNLPLPRGYGHSFSNEWTFNQKLHSRRTPLARRATTCTRRDYFLIQFGHNDQKTDPERGTTPKRTSRKFSTVYCCCTKSKQIQFY